MMNINTRWVTLILSAVFILVIVSSQQIGGSAEWVLHLQEDSVIYPMEQKDAVADARRRLMMEDFVPLSCNAALDQQPCHSWSNIFGRTTTNFEQRVVIDCGTCVTMDQPELTIHQGLDVRGRLIFPEGHRILLKTSSITVQGELVMDSTAAVDGSTWIHVLMIGDQPQSFRPIGENIAVCGGKDCDVDRKAITVAGGKVKIRGIGSNNPTWLRLNDVAGGTLNNPTSIVVDASVRGQWLPGAELLITSHTREWDDHQVRKITSVSTTAIPEGYVQLELDSPIRRPTTMLESNDYAVEVGLLSRNILFEGGKSSLQDGGHFWITHTPHVVQSISGVAFHHFGQQGKLGRYPIHFHYCGDVGLGSVVEKNTIRQSYQRCVVVHGTNNLLVKENIAFQTAGHCFVTEDGIETQNSFIRNLGAQIDAPVKLISGNGPESDKEPAIFWLTNPTNFVEGNVAAGSSGTGFWYELKARGPLKNLFPDPIHSPLGSFVNNVAHSNAEVRNGAVRLYPTGYLPNGSTETIFRGLKAYRNAGIGIVIHKVQNFELTGALLADNDMNIGLDRVEAVEIKDSTVIGMSDSFRDLMEREPETRTICGGPNRVVGIDLISWRLRNVVGGLSISNVDFRAFSDLNCRSVSAIQMNNLSVKQGVFELYTSFSNVLVEDGASFVDLCYAASSDIDSVYFIDTDGSLSPSSVSTAGPSALVSNSAKMTTFVDEARCTLIEEGCYQYCRETCFQSIKYEVDATNSDNLELKVCQRGNSARCIQMPWSKWYNENHPYHGDEPRSFLVHLPSGSYDAVFVDGMGNEAWPSFVERRDELALCSASVDVALIEPPPMANECTELVRNSNAEASSSEPLSWLSVQAGLELAKGDGLNGSNAITSKLFLSSRLLQYIDTRCMLGGTEYRVKGYIKLITERKIASVCDPNNVFDWCPSVLLFADGVGDIQIASVLSTNTDPSGYQIFEGAFTVDQRVASSKRVYIAVDWIERNSNRQKRRVLVDNFSVTYVGRDVLPSLEPVSTTTGAPAGDLTHAPITALFASPRQPTSVPSKNPTDAPMNSLEISGTQLPTATPETFSDASERSFFEIFAVIGAAIESIISFLFSQIPYQASDGTGAPGSTLEYK